MSEIKMPTSPESTSPEPTSPESAGPESSRSSESGTQLRLLPGGTTRREWILDERTRKVGRQGVAQARAILRKHQPPQPVDAWSQAS